MDSVHHIWCPLFFQEFQDLPDGAETTLTNQHGADNWKILPGVPLYDTIVIVTGESVRRDYMSVYGYPVPTTPWLNTAPGLFIDG
ncbi:TPA: hypothetical protein HLZ34_24520, partial [Escherichia coli]|nr:hypothetical protein [Escherichia coli]HAJ5642351.1 hypothetical protein [Escherichia coli]